MEPTFFTAVEISSILKISRALAYRLIAQGQIPSVRFGRTVRVKQVDLERFLQQNSSEYRATVTETEGARPTLESRVGQGGSLERTCS
jgi:excisionase family DNA binding protein